MKGATETLITLVTDVMMIKKTPAAIRAGARMSTTETVAVIRISRPKMEAIIRSHPAPAITIIATILTRMTPPKKATGVAVIAKMAINLTPMTIDIIERAEKYVTSLLQGESIVTM